MFLRGGDVLVCIAVREGMLVGPQGWHCRDVLGADGDARELTPGESLAHLLDEHGTAVLERAC